jgi:hypothetical protein
MSHVAIPYVAGSPNAEVTGHAMIAFANNLQAVIIEPILDIFDIHDIDINAWYPHQTWLDILKYIEDNLGDDANRAFEAFGKQVVKTAVMPPDIKTIPDVLHTLHAIHHVNLRHIPDTEGYGIQQISENHYIVYHNTPNPEVAIHAFLLGLAERFKQPNETCSVQPTHNDRPEMARSAYDVKWG